MIAERALMRVGLRLIAVWFLVEGGIAHLSSLIWQIMESNGTALERTGDWRWNLLNLSLVCLASGATWWFAGSIAASDDTDTREERSLDYQSTGIRILGAFFLVNGTTGLLFHYVASRQPKPEDLAYVQTPSGQPQDLAYCIAQMVLGAFMAIGLQRFREFWSVSSNADSDDPR